MKIAGQMSGYNFLYRQNVIIIVKITVIKYLEYNLVCKL